MVTEQDIEDIWQRKRGILHAYALRYLPTEHRDYASDVVSDAMLSAWKNRSSVTDLLPYVMRSIQVLSWKMFASRRIDVEGLNDECAIRDQHPNPLQSMLEAEEEAGRLPRRERIIGSLGTAMQSNYREWSASGFRSASNREYQRAFRLRRAISRAIA